MTVRPAFSVFSSLSRTATVTLLLLVAILCWDLGGLDLATARLFGNADGFPLRDNPFISDVLHDDARRLSWLLIVVLCAAIWWPFGWLRRVPIERRVQLVVGGLLSVLVISILKSASAVSCPWDLAEFGGVARHLSHWALGERDGGPGRCFPAGHASAGFAFIGGWFVFRREAPAVARGWLVASVVAGFVLGFAQQARGAHFMSHTLWTGWLCWTVAWAADAVAVRRIPVFAR